MASERKSSSEVYLIFSRIGNVRVKNTLVIPKGYVARLAQNMFYLFISLYVLATYYVC